MDYKRRIAGVLSGLGLLLLAGFGPLGSHLSQNSWQPAKLGFSYLTPVQYKDLWRRADDYAMAEAFLKQCGRPSFVERRMWLAAKDCIEAQALGRVAAYFRRKLAELSSKNTFVCDTEHSKALMKHVRARIDHDVEEVRSMCRSCLFC